MNKFDIKVDILYHLCRRVQKETDTILAYEVMKFKDGICVDITIANNDSFEKVKMYSVVEGRLDEEETFKDIKERLEKILMEEK